MRSWKILRGWVIAILIVGGGAAAVPYLFFRSPPVPVRVHRVGKGIVEEIVSSTKAGSVRSRRVAALGVEAPGTVTAVHVREGERVDPGAPLLSLDRREAEANLSVASGERKAAEARLNEAASRFAEAERDDRRLQDLLKTRTVSQAEADQARTRLEVARAAKAAGEAALELQTAALRRTELLLARTRLHAPFAGIVSEARPQVGEWVAPGQPLFTLLDPNDLYVRAEIDEVDLAAVRVGLEARVALDPWKDRRFGGKVSRVASYVTEVREQNRTVEIEVELPPPADGALLRHGISADVELIVTRKEEVLRIPTLALLEGNRALVVADGFARRRDVKVGLRNWEYAEVLGGLAPGEAVIVSQESDQVKDGVEVEVGEETLR